MPDISGVSSATSQAVNAAATAAGTTPNAVVAAATGGGGGQSTNFKSLKDFKTKFPVVYNQMMVGIAYHITTQMKHEADRLKEEIRKMNPK